MTTDDRTMEAALAGLGVAAPASLAPNVLADIGLADRYARFDSPIGQLVVAWNGLGVSAVEAAPDDATFEANHLARTGRSAHAVGFSTASMTIYLRTRSTSAAASRSTLWVIRTRGSRRP